MRKRECILLAATALVVLAAILLGSVARSALRPGDPVVNGRPLGFWLRQLDAETAASPSWDAVKQLRGTNRPAGSGPATAVRRLGTNALPYLLHALTNTDSNFRTRVRAFLQGKLHCNLVHSASELRRGALLGFAVLGPVAKPALPALVGALDLKSQSKGVRGSVALVLAFIGPAGQASLVQGLTSTNPAVRHDSMVTLELCQVSTPAVLQGLMRAAVRNPASAPLFISLACDLGRNGGALLVPFVTNEIRSPFLRVRLEAIGELGKLAREGIHSQVAVAAPGAPS